MCLPYAVSHMKTESGGNNMCFKIEKPSLEELHEELVVTCKEIVSDIFLLECLIQYSKEAFTVTGEYSDEDCGLTLCRVVDYIEQHIKDIETLSGGIKKHLCESE